MAVPTPEEFRQAMALVPTPVTVVTAPGESVAAGATANAVASLSLEPPLMLVCLDRRSRTLAAVRRTGRFGVNVLRDGDEAVARVFATDAPHEDKWAGVGMKTRGGVPMIEGAVVWVACELRDLLDGGDHVIVTGIVEELGTGGGDPLLFHAGGYRALDGPG